MCTTHLTPLIGLVAAVRQVYKARTPSLSHHVLCDENKKLAPGRREAARKMHEELSSIGRKSIQELQMHQLAGARGVVTIQEVGEEPQIVFEPAAVPTAEVVPTPPPHPFPHRPHMLALNSHPEAQLTQSGDRRGPPGPPPRMFNMFTMGGASPPSTVIDPRPRPPPSTGAVVLAAGASVDHELDATRAGDAGSSSGANHPHHTPYTLTIHPHHTPYT
jgi:hypothetical protein